ncbi:MAG: lamin tail domain-containing protein, partial [Verrucomicrobiota bacterium]|nr:lamin tail domain-containing protein [Verrucomicrobiota bacterium]
WIRTRDQLLGKASGSASDNYFPRRTDIVLNQFKSRRWYPGTAAPDFSQHGGSVSSNFNLSINSPGNGTIYYTLDGTDPRTPASAAVVTEHVLVPELSTKRAIMPVDNSLANTWFGIDFDDSSWAEGELGAGYDSTNGRYIEIIDPNFNFSDQTDSSKTETIYMRMDFEVDNPSLFDTLTLKVRYDDGFVAYLNGTEIIRDQAGGSPGTPLGYDATASSSHTDSQAEVFQSFLVSEKANLLKKGNNVLAIHGLNVSAGSSDFLIDASLIASEGIGGGNGGLSDTAITYDGSIKLTGPETMVRARAFSGNEWSALTEAVFLTDVDPAGPQNLVISKIHYRPSPPTDTEIEAGHNDRNDFEYIELMNIGEKSIDLRGMIFDKGVDFDFNEGNSLVIESGKRALIIENDDAFKHRFGNGLPVLGKFANNTNLSNGGERILLLATDGSSIRDFEYDDDSPWPETPDGKGYALVLRSPESNPDHKLPENWQPSSILGGNPGAEIPTTGFDDWQVSNFSKSELENIDISGPGANPDGDLFTNLEEFLSGNAPKSFDSSDALLDIKVESTGPDEDLGESAFLKLRINKDARSSLDWKVLGSSDGSNWEDAMKFLEFSDTEDLGNGNELIRYRIKPQQTEKKLFFRIQTRP